MSDVQGEFDLLELNTRIWKISVHTRHGVDQVLLQQDYEPHEDDLMLLTRKFEVEFDMVDEVSVEVDGWILPKHIPRKMEDVVV